MTGNRVSKVSESRFPLHRTQGVIRAGIFIKGLPENTVSLLNEVYGTLYGVTLGVVSWVCQGVRV